MIRAGRLEGGAQAHSGKAAPPFISLPISLWGVLLERAGRCDEEPLLWGDCAGLCKVSCFIGRECYTSDWQQRSL